MYTKLDRKLDRSKVLLKINYEQFWNSLFLVKLLIDLVQEFAHDLE